MKREYRKRAAKRKSMEALKNQSWNETLSETPLDAETNIDVDEKNSHAILDDASGTTASKGDGHKGDTEPAPEQNEKIESDPNTDGDAENAHKQLSTETVEPEKDNPTAVASANEIESSGKITNQENECSVMEPEQNLQDNSSARDTAAQLLEQQALTSAANDAAVRFYSSLNLLATRAFFNVKQEPMEMPLADKIMSSLNAGYFGATPDALMGRDLHALGGDAGLLNAAYRSPLSGMMRPPAELSPETFAEQLRHSDSASMVVCRPHAGKTASNYSGPLESPPTGSGRMISGQHSHQSSASLHHFVTRYTIEKPDDPSRLGVEICLENNNTNEPVIEVECGGNKGMLYVTKLCQGSKGQSILFNEEWLTPNEFQFISGRETAKDWKRSIRHCGKSLKTLMSKGVLQVHPPVCECDYCKGHGPAVVEKSSKKRPITSGSADIVRRNSMSENTAASTGPSTPSSTDSNKAFGMPDTHAPTAHKGREGGLSSIISQLHSKKAISGNDVAAGGESLDLSVRSSSGTSLGGDCDRKRQLRSSSNQGDSPPLKRRYSDDDGAFIEMNIDRNRDQHRPNGELGMSASEPLCLASNGPKKEISHKTTSDKEHSNQSPKYRSQSNHTSPNGRGLYPDFRDPVANGYRPNLGFAEYALFDAMKRAVASVSGGNFPDGTSTPPTPTRMDESTPARGYISLDSTSPRSRRYDGSSPQNCAPGRNHQQPMMELTSPHRKNGSSRDHYYGSSQDDRQINCGVYDPPSLPGNKAPVTVLHHRPTSYSPHSGTHHPTHTHHYFGMPPPPNGGNRHSPDTRRGRNSRREFPYTTSPRRTNSSGRRKEEQRSRPQGRSDSRGTKMLNLQNHAIPMLSLTYSKKKDAHGRHSDSSPPEFPVSGAPQVGKRVSSDDELARSSDLTRRLSSSAPPISLPGSIDRKSYMDENNNRSRDYNSVPKRVEGNFETSKLSSKSASPGSSSRMPFFCDDRQNHEGLPADRCCGYGEPSCQHSILDARLRDLACAIDEMSELSVDGVCEFLKEVGCGEYQDVFREHCIDGDALPLLAERHLVDRMGLKLGHALKVIARVHRRLGNHCSLVSNHDCVFRNSSTTDYLSYRKQVPSPLTEQNPEIPHPVDGAKETNTDEPIKDNPIQNGTK